MEGPYATLQMLGKVGVEMWLETERKVNKYKDKRRGEGKLGDDMEAEVTTSGPSSPH